MCALFVHMKKISTIFCFLLGGTHGLSSRRICSQLGCEGDVAILFDDQLFVCTQCGHGLHSLKQVPSKLTSGLSEDVTLLHQLKNNFAEITPNAPTELRFKPDSGTNIDYKVSSFLEQCQFKGGQIKQSLQSTTLHNFLLIELPGIRLRIAPRNVFTGSHKPLARSENIGLAPGSTNVAVLYGKHEKTKLEFRLGGEHRSAALAFGFVRDPDSKNVEWEKAALSIRNPQVRSLVEISTEVGQSRIVENSELYIFCERKDKSKKTKSGVDSVSLLTRLFRRKKSMDDYDNSKPKSTLMSLRSIREIKNAFNFRRTTMLAIQKDLKHSARLVQQLGRDWAQEAGNRMSVEIDAAGDPFEAECRESLHSFVAAYQDRLGD